MEKLDRVRSPPRLGPPVILILLMFMMALLSTPITPTNGQSPASSASCRTCSRRSEVKVAMVSHGNWFTESFWVSARKGIERANALFNVSAVPMNPDVFDFAAIANLVNKAAENYSLLGSTVVDGVTIGAALRSAVDKGKSVISFNSGDSVLNNTKVHSHIGQPEYIAGYRTGVAFARAGRSNLLCIQHETGNAGLVARCNGLLDGLKSINNAGTMAMVAMDGNSASALSASLSNYLTNQQSTDGIVSLNTEVTKVVVQEVESRNRLSSISIAGFDLSNDVFTFIQQGKMVFAVDQQEFLQAFATIQQLKVLHMTRGMRALNQLLLSGPNMVTTANVQRKLCQANPNRPGCTAVNPSSLTIGVVSTSSWGSPDAFTQQAKYGVQAALKEFGTKLRYLDTNIFDLAGLVSQVQAAISSGEVNALVMPIPSTAANHNFTTLVANAAAANIPVISWATGAELGSPLVSTGQIRFHVGYNSQESGGKVGRKLDALIPANSQVLCLTLELGNEDMVRKCTGINSVLTNGRTVATHGGTGVVLPVSARNTLQAISTIQSELRGNSNIRAIIYPSAESARVAMTAIAEANLPASRTITVAGYGMASDIATLVTQSKIAFTVDEQPFLQTYMAVSSASFLLTDGYILQNSLVETGPVILDRDTMPAAICRADTARDPSEECPPCPSQCEVNGVCLDSGECRCNEGWILGPQKNCQVKDPGLRIIDWNSGLAIGFLSITSFGIAASVFISAFIVKNKTNALIKASSWTISSVMQIGFLLIYLSLFLFVGRPTESMCMARPFVLSVGFSLVIGLLLAKTFRLYRLFHSAAIRTKNRSGISDQTVFLHGSSIVAVNLLICIIWAGVDPPKPKELFIAEGRTNMVCMGQGADAAISAVLIAYNVILIVCGVALGFLTRNIQARFNESKSIGLAMYNLTALAAIGLPLLYATGSDLNLTFSVLGVLIIIGSFSTQGILFGSKVWAVLQSSKDTGADGGAGDGKVVLSSWGNANMRKKTTSVRGIGAGASSIFTEAKALTRRSWETLAARVPVRVVKSRLDAITAMWHMGAVFMLRDAAMGTFFVMVLDADNSGQPGTIFDMSSASARVKEETNITVGAGGSETSSALGGSSVSPSTATSAAELNGRGAGGAEVHDGFGGGAGIICVTSTSGARLYIQLQDQSQVRQWRQVLDATSVNGGSNSGSQTETSNPSRARGSSQQGALAAQSGTSETGGSGKTPTGTGSKTVPE